MGNKSLKSATISGLIYRFGERILAQLVSTIVTIILARILMPEDYGVISIVLIVISICNVFVASGFGNALIQKKDSDEEDFSSVFWVNLGLSFLLCLIIWFVSPYIAEYYEMKELTSVLRVMSFRLQFAAVNSIQSAYVSKKLLFKKFFWASIVGTILSGFIGIFLAYNGAGVWALVAQYLSNSIINTFMLLIIIRWKPHFIFSAKKVRILLPFGAKVLLGGLLDAVCEEIRSLIIGKKYTETDLAYYTKGKQYPQLLANNVSTTIANVMFPIFSKCQDDRSMLLSATRKSIQICSYVMFPLLIGFGAISESFVKVLLTDKWLEIVPYMQIFCIMFLFKPIKNIGKSVLRSIGKTNADLYVNIIEKVIGVLCIVFLMEEGVIYIAIGALIPYVISSIIYTILESKYIGYSIVQQIKDILAPTILSAIMFVVVLYLGSVGMPTTLALFVQVIAGGAIYILLSILFRVKAYKYLLSTGKDYWKRIRK